MAKYKTEKRKANVGERILITTAGFTFGDYDNGDSFTVIGLFNGVKDGVRVRTGDFPQIYDDEYEVIIEAKPSYPERISLLESQVAELQAQVEALQKPKKFVATASSPMIPKPTPNEQRKAAIERAKAFVAVHSDLWFTVEFFVNSDKRTVVALLRSKRRDVVITKAIAKCAPDDVFNADIGKAIALGRALGLDVSEFENAVKPTEVVVGHKVIRFNKFGDRLGELVVRKVRILSDGEYGPNTHYLNNGNCYCENYGDHIADDTEAQY